MREPNHRNRVARRSAWAVALMATLAWSQPTLAVPPTASASLSPREVGVGEPARLTVTVEGRQNPRIEIPSADGLEIRGSGSTQQISIVNGATTQSVTQHFTVRALRQGRFTLRPVVDGTPLRPLEVFVGPARPGAGGATTSNRASPFGGGLGGLLGGNPFAAGPASAGLGPQAPPRRAPHGGTVGSPSVSRRGTSPGRRAFLRLRVPKDELVVGESVPVTVRAYVKAGTAGVVTGQPELSSDSFAFQLDPDARQGETEIDGAPYATLTWRGRMTALLPGEHQVEASVPARLRWREIVEREQRYPRGSLFDDLMSDPFFASAFGGRTPFAGFGSFPSIGYGPTRTAEVTLHHDLGVIRVTEPPAEGRPDDFSGAVGRFEASVTIDAPSARVGEPITAYLSVTGEGTFDRLHHELYPEGTEGVRVYPASASFEASDRSGRRGTKVFEQTLVPTRAGTLALPALTFSVFDPGTGEYVTLRAEPPPLEVLPGTDGTTSLSDSLADAGDRRERALDAPPEDMGPAAAALRPLPHTPWILALPALLLLGGVGLATWLGRRDPTAAARRRAHRGLRRELRAARRAMRAAARRDDGADFLRAAERATRLALSEQLDVPAEAVTLADARARLTALPEAMIEVLERADAARFGDASPPEHPEEWLARVDAALDEPLTPTPENR